MSGARVVIDANTEKVSRALDTLYRHLGKDLHYVMRDIGEFLGISQEERFVRQESPDGAPWAALSPEWKAEKERLGKNPDKVLTFYGDLRGSMRYRITDGGEALEFGTDKEYAAIHQFGGLVGGVKSSRSGGSIGGAYIPPRPYLGLSPSDEDEILEILGEWLEV